MEVVFQKNIYNSIHIEILILINTDSLREFVEMPFSKISFRKDCGKRFFFVCVCKVRLQGFLKNRLLLIMLIFIN